MADQENDPHDEKVRTVPLPSDEAGEDDRVITQENQSPEVAFGGGEWPSPDEPPTEDHEDGGFPSMRDVLEADPVAGGSQSTPDGDDGDEATKLR